MDLSVRLGELGPATCGQEASRVVVGWTWARDAMGRLGGNRAESGKAHFFQERLEQGLDLR